MVHPSYLAGFKTALLATNKETATERLELEAEVGSIPG
jgi:hypothetical protein